MKILAFLKFNKAKKGFLIIFILIIMKIRLIKLVIFNFIIFNKVKIGKNLFV